MFSALCPLCLDASHWHVRFSSSSPWQLFLLALEFRRPESPSIHHEDVTPPACPPHYSSLEPTSSSDNSSYHAVKRREAPGPSGATRSPPSHFVFKLLCKVPPSGNAAPTAFSCCCPALCLPLSLYPFHHRITQFNYNHILWFFFVFNNQLRFTYYQWSVFYLQLLFLWFT